MILSTSSDGQYEGKKKKGPPMCPISDDSTLLTDTVYVACVRATVNFC